MQMIADKANTSLRAPSEGLKKSKIIVRHSFLPIRFDRSKIRHISGSRNFLRRSQKLSVEESPNQRFRSHGSWNESNEQTRDKRKSMPARTRARDSSSELELRTRARDSPFFIFFIFYFIFSRAY